MNLAAYLLYCILWDCGLLAGCAYVVFCRGHSGWWFVLAIIMSGCGGFSTDKFNKLVSREREAGLR